MGRKFSKKINKKILLQGLGLFVFFAAATTILFQNCSQVSVSDMTAAGKEEQARILRIGAGEVLVEVGASKYDKAEADFTVGLDTVPNLRQLWVLDNSGTMEANNLNLANSFGTMFDQSNKDSLYKFDTTAYLFNTAQTVPSFVTGSTADKNVLLDAASLQGQFFALPSISESVFNNDLRTVSQNSGKIPGDNVGIEIRRAGSSNDFSVKAAPVLSKKVTDGNLSLVAAINKPANTDTTNFEEEFKGKLEVLKSARVPTSTSNGFVVQQSSKIIDKESGLCAVARILDNPDAMFSKSDLLAFTIVTDENDNDVNGTNCLKRTAVLTGNEDVVNGRCSEYETAFSYSVTTITPGVTTCTVSGNKGYEAQFDYRVYSADVSWRSLDTAGKTTYKTPKTRIVYSTPKFKNQQRQTNVLYYNQSCTTASTEYSRRTTPVSYYTQTCTKYLSDGIEKEVCTADAGVKVGYVYGDQRNNCNAAALSLNSKAIVALRDGITADKLPTCNQVPAFGAYAATPTCSVGDTANCLSRAVPSVCSISGTQKNGWVVGDKTSTCSAAATSLSSSAATVVRDSITAAHMPSCPTVQWNDNSCNLTDTTNCRQVSDGYKTDNVIYVYGTIVNGTTACTQHADLPANALSPVCDTKDSYAETGDGNCPNGHAAYGCLPTTTTDSFKNASQSGVPNLKTQQECYDWAVLQTNQRIRNSADVTCTFKNDPANVKSSILFAASSDMGNTLAVNADCGSSRLAFYNALSAADRAKITGETPCKIAKVTTGTTTGRTLTGIDCQAQKANDCSALNYRDCTSNPVTGSNTSSTGSAQPHGKINMKAACDSKCNTLLNGFCEGYSNQNITVSQYLSAKYLGTTSRVINCSAVTPVEKTVVSTITARPVAQKSSFCPAHAETGVPSYFIQTGNPYRTNTPIEEFVAGNATGVGGGQVPAKNLINYIKDKIAQEELNVNFTVFIRRTGDPVGTGSGIDYIGTHYESLVQQTGGQAYSVTASSYADALKNLSAVIKSKLIRSFTVNAIQDHQVITAVTIVRPSGSQTLALGEWTQSDKTITVAPHIAFDEGDRIVVQFQNNDGYIKSQLKKIFIIDEMRPDQIILEVVHIKSNGETVLLRTDQWLKVDNTVKIDDSVIINGGDQFRIKFKNNTTEE